MRDEQASEVARLLAAANRWRQATADRDGYCHLLETVLNLEGDIHWAEDLFWVSCHSAVVSRVWGRPLSEGCVRVLCMLEIVVKRGNWERHVRVSAEEQAQVPDGHGHGHGFEPCPDTDIQIGRTGQRPLPLSVVRGSCPAGVRARAT
ncbi:hypothetical protein [Streptomyces sp. NPDC001275]